MQTKHFGTSALILIALAVCVGAVGRSSPATALPYGDIAFVSQGSNGFIAVNRRTAIFPGISWSRVTTNGSGKSLAQQDIWRR